jgi:hypothetical protein
MGKLLDMAIFGSKAAAAAAPTFAYASDGVDITELVTLYKNGTIIFQSSAPKIVTTVSVVAGDTVRMTCSTLDNQIEYSDNASLTVYNFDSGTKTLVAGHTYTLYCVVP